MESTLACILRIQDWGWGGVDWIRLAQDRDKWADFVNLRGPIKCGEFLDKQKTC
jgi:hypothetical protein